MDYLKTYKLFCERSGYLLQKEAELHGREGWLHALTTLILRTDIFRHICSFDIMIALLVKLN